MRKMLFAMLVFCTILDWYVHKNIVGERNHANPAPTAQLVREKA